MNCISNCCPFGAVDVLLNPKDELVVSNPGTNVPPNPNVDEGLVATVPALPSAVKTEDGSQAAALPLPQPAFEVDENPPATVPLSQSEVKEEQKQPVVRKEDKKSVAAIPLSHSAVKEDEKPAASIAPPQPAVMDNIPKHTQLQDAHTGERPPKKLKLSQVTSDQDMDPETTEQRPLELPPKNIVNSLDLLFLYPTCYFCSYISLQECKCAPFVFNVTAFGEETQLHLSKLPHTKFCTCLHFSNTHVYLFIGLRGGMRHNNAIMSTAEVQ